MPNDVFTPHTAGRTDESSLLGDKLSGSTTHLKEKASEFGRKAADAIDGKVASAAIGLEQAAATLHGRADNLPGVDKVSSLAHSAADKLSATAGYFREHDVDRIKDDLKTLVKNNPGPSLLIAGVIGFFLGRAFTSSNRA